MILLARASGCGIEPHAKPATLDQLIAQASSADAKERRRAIYMLGAWFAGEAAPAVPVLTNALNDTDDGVVASAALVLGKIGMPAREAVPSLVRVMQSKRGALVTSRCAHALGRIAHDPSICVPALGAFGADAAEAVPDIIAYLEGEFGEDALLALGSIGGAAAEAVPVIVRIMDDPGRDELLRQVASGILVSIGAPAVPALARLVREGGSIQAMDALGTMGR